MEYFHGTKQSKNYFEGWYIRLAGNDVLALIPGIHLDQTGHGYAFIQVITRDKSYYLTYPKEALEYTAHKFAVRIGRNLFTEKGVKLDIKKKGLRIKGSVAYGRLNRPCYPVMGPFSLLPVMQCSHGVISMYHRLSGSVSVNGRRFTFDGGRGYMEMDWGSSFPRKYLWVQGMEKSKNTSVMAAAATVPLGRGGIRGCVCIVYYRGREYRLATYLGVKIIECSKNQLILRQGKYLLLIEAIPDGEKGQRLKAPVMGDMKRMIHENACAKVRFRFYRKNRKLFDFVTDEAGYEWVR